MTTSLPIAERNSMLRAKFGVMLAMLLLLFVGTAHAVEVIPPVPEHYFNDYAHVVSPATADDLNRQLEQFERDTSNQVRVVIYPKMQSDSDVADYTVRVAQSWHVGMKGKDNGAVLFVFVQDRTAFIEVGYGLEGVLTDATCKDIIDQGIAPAFKVGDYDAGLRAGVAGILAATKGEFKGTGQTVQDQQAVHIATGIIGDFPCIASAIGLFVLFGLLLLILHTTGGTFYQHHARSIGLFENIYLFIFQMGLNVIFSAGSSGSSSSGGSGSASSGGGSFGGGGAGGSW